MTGWVTGRELDSRTDAQPTRSIGRCRSSRRSTTPDSTTRGSDALGECAEGVGTVSSGRDSRRLTDWRRPRPGGRRLQRTSRCGVLQGPITTSRSMGLRRPGTPAAVKHPHPHRLAVQVLWQAKARASPSAPGHTRPPRSAPVSDPARAVGAEVDSTTTRGCRDACLVSSACDRRPAG